MNQFHDKKTDGFVVDDRLRHRALKITLITAVVWLSVIVASMALISHYSNSPGRTGAIPVCWSAESQIQLDTNRPTLIMFAHPRCPCTRASLGELGQLMADCQGRLSAQVWFIKPAGTVEDWTNTDLWCKAAAIPGVTVHCDTANVESRRFHAETSGQTVLYDQNGRLLFQGGITISRGHAGDNPGRSAVETLLEQKHADQIQAPVFGCALFETQCQQEQGGVVWKQ